MRIHTVYEQPRVGVIAEKLESGSRFDITILKGRFLRNELGGVLGVLPQGRNEPGE